MTCTSAYRDGKYLFFILLVALYGICFFQIVATIPQFFSKQCHYSEDTIGWLLAINGLIVVLVEMPLVTALQRQKNIFRFIIGGTLCIPVAFAMLLIGHCVLIWPVIYIIILSFSEIFAMPFMMNHALSQPLKERQGQYAALYSIAFGIALMTLRHPLGSALPTTWALMPPSTHLAYSVLRLPLVLPC